MRTIGIVSVGRSDYGIYRPILERIHQDSELSLHLMVTGMHLSPEFGYTVRVIEDEGYPIAERVETLLSSDTPEGVAKSIGLGIMGFGQVFARSQPDIVVVMGDRFEMYAAAVAALPFRIPLAHIHGGEVTIGAIDEALRHSMTKLSHLHFVSTEAYGERVIRMGEEPWRVTVSGAPSLDNLRTTPLLDRVELEALLGFSPERPFALVTYHPVTLERWDTSWQVGELLAALEDCGLPLVFTMPNADSGGRLIMEIVRRFVAGHPSARLVENMGTRAYFSTMTSAAVMVGNSSSGIIEAASFSLPVVNIGTRQEGRIRGPNVVDVGYARHAIVDGVKQAMSPGFRRALEGVPNLYGEGRASEAIVGRLKTVPLDERLVMKRFHDWAPFALVER